MLDEDRVCRNCGAHVGSHERSCPNCGRLLIDRRSSRLGARPTQSAEQNAPVREPMDDTKGKVPADAAPTDEGGSTTAEPTPKPASY